MDYNNYIKDLEKTGKLYVIEAKVKRVELKHLDVFIGRKIIIFDKYNIITGLYGSGKTFLIDLIFDAYSQGKTRLDSSLPETLEFRDSSVKIVYKTIRDWKYTFPKKSDDFDLLDDLEDHKEKCFLFDEPDILYDKKERDCFLKHLRELDAQIIITSSLENNYEHLIEFKKIKI